MSANPVGGASTELQLALDGAKKMNEKPETQPLEDFFPMLAQDEAVRMFLINEYGERAPHLIKAMETKGKIPDEFEFFEDNILEYIHSNSEEVESYEIECLSSYSTTSTVTVEKFLEIFWVSNFEFGDICYFSNEEDAMKAAKEEFGHFDNPEINLDNLEK
jgi:hypothetical protein